MIKRGVLTFFGLFFVLSCLHQPSQADEPPIRDRRRHDWRGYYLRNQYRTEDFTCPCPSCNSLSTGRFGITGLGGRPHVDKTMGCRSRRCGRGLTLNANLNQGRCFSSPSFGGACLGGCRYGGAGGCGGGCGGCDSGCPPTYQSTGCGPIQYQENFPRLRAFSVQWPRPFSPYFDDLFPGSCCDHQCHSSGNGTRRSCGHIFDALDCIANVKVVKRNVRKDSGYEGPDCDPYGKLGISNYPVQHPPKKSPGGGQIAPGALGYQQQGPARYYQANFGNPVRQNPNYAANRPNNRYAAHGNYNQPRNFSQQQTASVGYQRQLQNRRQVEYQNRQAVGQNRNATWNSFGSRPVNASSRGRSQVHGAANYPVGGRRPTYQTPRQTYRQAPTQAAGQTYRQQYQPAQNYRAQYQPQRNQSTSNGRYSSVVESRTYAQQQRY